MGEEAKMKILTQVISHLNHKIDKIHCSYIAILPSSSQNHTNVNSVSSENLK